MSLHNKALFTKNVKNMKAWQLYVGQSMWLFFVGILFYLLKIVIDMTFLHKSKIFSKGFSLVKGIASGTVDADDGSAFASKVLGMK